MYTCEEARQFLNEALESRTKILKSIRYSIEGSRNSKREVEHERLAAVRKDIQYWEQMVQAYCDDCDMMSIKQGYSVE